MASKVTSYEGLPLTRINYSNAWQCVMKTLDSTVTVMYSYNTPIIITKCKNGRVYVKLNDAAYNYSRTTSKHLSQWLSELHLFTCWGSKLPWSFRDVIEDYKLTFGEFVVPINNDDIELWLMNEETLAHECKRIAATTHEIVRLTDIATM